MCKSRVAQLPHNDDGNAEKSSKESKEEMGFVWCQKAHKHHKWIMSAQGQEEESSSSSSIKIKIIQEAEER